MVLRGTAEFGEVLLGENRVQVLVLRFVAQMYHVLTRNKLFSFLLYPLLALPIILYSL